MESKGSAEAHRRELARHLRETVDEATAGIVGRMNACDEEWTQKNGGHTRGVEKAVRAILEHTCCVIEGNGDQRLHPDVIAHSRALARAGFETHTLLERYTEGKTVFKEHLRQANAAVKGRSQAGYIEAERSIESAFESLLRTVGEEHRAECERLKRSSATRQLEGVRRALSGELNYLPEGLGYDSSATHIGMVGSGLGVEHEIRRLAKMLGGQLLIVQASPDQFWAWIGLKLESSADRLDDALKTKWADAVRMGIGEAADGISGWRRTHHEAAAALHAASSLGHTTGRYPAVAVIAAILNNALTQAFLEERFLSPLAGAQDEGRMLRSALHAYFSANRNKSSAASALGISRQMLSKYLRQAEERIGRPLAQCGFELEAALLLHLATKRGGSA